MSDALRHFYRWQADWFVYLAMLAFMLGLIAAAALGFVVKLFPWLLVLVIVLLIISLFTRLPELLYLAFLLLGLLWGGIAAAQVASFSIPADEAVFFEGRVVEISSREENYFSQLAEYQNDGYSFVLQGKESRGWRGRIMVIASPVQPELGDRMQVSALIAASSTFIETVLGIKYKEHDEGNIYKGGPSYYMKNGLGLKKLGALYAIIVLIAYIGGFLGIQSNTIVKSFDSIVSVPTIVIATIICLFTAVVIFGGVSKIVNVTNKLVPTMTILYVGIALIIVLKNFSLFPTVLLSIFKEAFHLESFFSAFLPTMIVGIQRGIFSNEAGLGTGSLASSTTSDTDAVRNGFIQVVGIYITTLLICTSTAFVILTSNYNTINFHDINGIEITQYAFTYHLGNLGNYIVFGSIILFSFSTILTGYYYGESCLKYFFHNLHPRLLFLLKMSAILVIFLGCFLSPTILWNLVDIFVAFLAIINMPILYFLLQDVIDICNDYRKRL